MDLEAGRLRLKPAIGILAGWPNLKLAGRVTASVFLILAVAKLAWDLPKPLLATVGVIFVAWSGVFWSWNRRSKRAGAVQVGQLLLVWGLVTGLLLGGVYRVDRAGWLWFRLTGYNVTWAEDLPAHAPIADFVNQHPYFVVDAQDSAHLILHKGVYDVDETVVVPEGATLTIEPGAVLRFGAGRSLVSYSPILARGTDREPIVFTARNKWLKWGAVGVVRAGKSVFEHVRFEHGRQALVNGVEFTGGLALIATDVEITHSEFVNMFGKDAVNVRHGDVLVRNNLIRNTFKDGLDLDGGTGEISHNRFVNCGDEGIDLSENDDVRVFENQIVDARGGRIEADNDLERIRSQNELGYSASD